MNEMPWWAILLIVIASFFLLFVWMMLGMGVGEFAANAFLFSVIGFAVLVYAAVRFCFPRQQDKP